MTAKAIQNWKKQFLANASKAFESDDSSNAELAKLRSENDALAKRLGGTTVERDRAAGKLESLDLSNKRGLVDSKLTLSKTCQCRLRGISRSTLY